MNCLCTAVNGIRPNRKRFSISGSSLSLVLFLVLFAALTSAHPDLTLNENSKVSNSNLKSVGAAAARDVDDTAAEMIFDAGDDYAEVDNVEWHHVKMVDGIMHEDHPIIMYKEDFVSEDYDPTKHTLDANSHSDESSVHPRRKYKNIKRHNRLNRTTTATATATVPVTNTEAPTKTDKYHALKPEKMYFDVLPQAPVVVSDEFNSNDSKFEPSQMRVEVISLLDEEKEKEKENENNDATVKSTTDSPSKELLNKRPKKFRRQRTRRSTSPLSDTNGHDVSKRSPCYYYERQGPNVFEEFNKRFMPAYMPQKPADAGNQGNSINDEVPPPIEFDNRFGGEDNTDRVVWGVSKTPVQKPKENPPSTGLEFLPPLFHDSRPQNADFSPFSTRRPATNQINNQGSQSSSNSNHNNNNRNNANKNNNIHFNNNNRRTTTTRRPITTRRTTTTTRRPAEIPDFPPLFHDSNPDQADFSFLRPQPSDTFTPEVPIRGPSASQPPNEERVISDCVWAISGCCSSTNTNIRYECFERLGCSGAFWDANPCGALKNAVLDFVSQQFQ